MRRRKGELRRGGKRRDEMRRDEKEISRECLTSYPYMFETFAPSLPGHYIMMVLQTCESLLF